MNRKVHKNIILSLLMLFLVIFSITLISGITSSNHNMEKLVPIKLNENENLKLLNNIKHNQNHNKQKIDSSDVLKINQFANKIARELFEENNNQIFSPISLYIALSTILEGTSSEIATKEITDLLGSDSDDLREIVNKIYKNNYFSNKNGRTYLANSVWIDKNTIVEQNYLNTLEKHYFTECYHINFKNQFAKQSIIKWINYYTEDLLKLDLNKFPIKDNLSLMLINTIYFNNNWMTSFDKNFTTIDDFYYENNLSVKTNYMTHMIDTKYKITEEYSIVNDKFENGYTISYLMPTSEKFVYQNDAFNNLLDGTISLSLPKIRILKQYDLKENLKNLGINQIFDNNYSLEKITKNICLEFIRQDVGIEFSEKGVEASAATSSGISKTSLPIADETIILNKPFYYIIKDENDIILFIGYLKNPSL